MAEVYLNGAFMAVENAKVSVLDRGFLFGDGVYEVIPVYRGHALGLDAHLDRLDASLAGIRLANPLARERWKAVIERLLNHAPNTDQVIYLQVTRGAAPVRDHRFPTGVEPTVLAMVKPLKARDPRLLEQGVAAILREDIRWQRCDIKSTSLVAAVLLRQAAAEQDAEEAILTRAGHLVEASTSNVFVARDGRVATPPKGHLLLSGITRDLVIELARADGLRVDEREIATAECQTADEIWISSSTREVLPVTRLDGRAVGNGCPGPLWRRIDARYQDHKAALGAERRG